MYIKPLATPVVRLSILSTLSTAQNYLRAFFVFLPLPSISLFIFHYPSVNQRFNVV